MTKQKSNVKENFENFKIIRKKVIPMNKIISVLLAFVMVFTAVSFTAFAADEIALPECEVTELKGDDLVITEEESFFPHDDIALDYALNFTALDTEEDLEVSPFKNYLADFELTFSKNVQVILAGSYKEFFDGAWVVLDDVEYEDFVAPKGGLEFNGGETVKIMEQFGKNFAKPGSNLNFTYADCINFVKSFNCGIKVVSPVDVTATLALRIYGADRENNFEEGGHDEYYPTDAEYTVAERVYVHNGAIKLDTVEDINNVEIDDYTSEETKDAVANAIKNLSSADADKVSAEIILAVGEDKSDFIAVDGTNNALIIECDAKDESEVVNPLLKNGVVFDVTAIMGNEEVKELDSPILVKIPLSEINLENDELIEKVYHEHGNEVEELEFIVEDDYLYVKMIKFSDISVRKAKASPADTAVLKLVEAPAEEGSAKFDLYLVGDTSNTVRNLSAGEFVITYPAGVNARYEMVANNETNIYKEEDGNKVTYRFNLKSVNVEDMWTADDANIINGNTIKIATLTVTGRNVKGDIEITEIIDMEKSFIDGNGTETAPIETTCGDKVSFDIPVPTRELTVKVDLSSYRTKLNDAAFQEMTLVIEGEDMDTPITIAIGNDTAVVENDVYIITKNLDANSLYKITLSAPGYRKADYEIQMNYDKTLTFWNIHKIALAAMEKYVDAEGNTRVDGKKLSNFLAGDIVDDTIINEYDLSAVVSYFGESTNDFTKAFAYSSYDINRDGKVDSKDVAIVLAGDGK